VTPDPLRRLRFRTDLLLLAYGVTACAAPAPATPVTFHEGIVARADSTMITLAADACQRHPYGSRIVETAQQVRVALSAIPPAGDAAPGCSDQVVVPLSKPVGDRLLVDASTGRQVQLVQRGVGALPPDD